MTRFLLALIAFYRRWISPSLHAVTTSRCKFLPTCSEYAAVAIATHGPLRGCRLAAWRLVRCHPFTPGGLDPCRRWQTGLCNRPLPAAIVAAPRGFCPVNRYHRESSGPQSAFSKR